MPSHGEAHFKKWSSEVKMAYPHAWVEVVKGIRNEGFFNYKIKTISLRKKKGGI